MLDRVLVAPLVAVAMLLSCSLFLCRNSSADEASDLAAREKEGCRTNLLTISKAIEAYQVDHKDIPNWLSDLVPNYLSDPNLLICPACRRSGKTEAPPLADPNISSSYLFEFCPLPLGSEAPGAPNRTRRDWKRRQMGLVGSKVPMVRCRHHDRALNLAFDGTVYESPMYWETMFTNLVSVGQLTPASLFANEASAPGTAPDNNSRAARKYPSRDPKTPKQLLDLTKFYNAMITESWHGGLDNQLQGLSSGVQNLGGIDFDVRGVIQLASKSVGTNFPAEVKGLPVHQKCQRIHFLHAAAWGRNADEGKQLGAYVVHYSTNQMRLEVPIIYGRSVRDWHAWPSEAPAPKELVVAWKGENGVTKRANSNLRLFLSTWNNVVPELEVDTIDFVSSLTNAAPFLVAISVE